MSRRAESISYDGSRVNVVHALPVAVMFGLWPSGPDAQNDVLSLWAFYSVPARLDVPLHWRASVGPCSSSVSPLD